MNHPNTTNIIHQLVNRESNVSRTNPQSFLSDLYRSRYLLAKNLFKTNLVAHYGCVNAIEFSHGDGRLLASGGDDRRVLIWDVEKCLAGLSEPCCQFAEHSSNIFCVAFDRLNRKILSGSNDNLIIIHDVESTKVENVYKISKPIFGLSVDPKCEHIFASAGEGGKLLVFDQRQSSDPLVVGNMRSSVHSVEYHPAQSYNLISANSIDGAAFWDIRKPKNPLMHYGEVDHPTSCMNVRFNSAGTLVLSLSRRFPPILYNVNSPIPVCTFYHENYYNSCTMKSCTFAGTDDELVLSGSDDFNLYVWRITDVNLEQNNQWVENTQMVLYGHRSIVNQVRYNHEKCLIASSGVEKDIKIWSPFNQNNWSGCLLEEATCSDNPRTLYTSSTLPAVSVWETSPYVLTTDEDTRMMSFFDSLVQQEIEGWETSSSSSDSLMQSPFDESHTESSNDETSFNNDSGISTAERPSSSRRLKKKKKSKKVKRKTSNKNKKSVHERDFPNRIAYLIATKRTALRQLAIKQATFGSKRKRLRKIIKPKNKQIPDASCSSNANGRILNTRTRRHGDKTEEPSTSTGISAKHKDNVKHIPMKKRKITAAVGHNNIDCNATGSKSTENFRINTAGTVADMVDTADNMPSVHDENRKRNEKHSIRYKRCAGRNYRKNNVQESDSD